MMLERTTRKITDVVSFFLVVSRNVNNAGLISDSKYVNTYDALLLALVELEDGEREDDSIEVIQNNDTHVSKMEGLRRLLSDLDSILKEGDIIQQSYIMDLWNDVAVRESTYAAMTKQENDDSYKQSVATLRKQIEPPLLEIYNKAQVWIDS